MSSKTIALTVFSALFASSLFAAAGEKLISDVAAAAGKTAWSVVPYETKDGIRGRMLYAPWGLKPRTPVEIPLGVKGRYRIRIGMGATRNRLEDASVALMLRLKRDPAPILMDAQAPTRDAGWWTQPVENEWKTVDLDTDDVLVVENRAGTRGMLYWVRLVPTNERGPKAYPYDIIATNDGYAPAADMDELYAPIMRLADSPVSEIHYCVGNGAYTFVVPSKVAIPTVLEKGAQYEGRYAEKCAETYTWIAKDHPHVLDELADFTHKLGMKFFVSFRTGCTVNHVRRGEQAGKVTEDPAGFGICRPEHLCRLWDGTVVPRFSYADKGVQDWFLKFYAEMLTEKVDGISLIWMRALPAVLFEDAFRSRFRVAYGEDLKKADDPRVGQLRTEIMTEFHRRVRALAGKRRVTIVTPPDRATCEFFGLDLKRLAREGLVDEFVAGNSKQSAIHDENIEYVDYPYFREACKGTKATFRTCFWGYPDHFTKAVAEGARGGMLWDAGVKPWPDWEATRLLGDRDGARAAAWEKAYPRDGRVHPLKTLDGLDAAVYPWHVAY